MLLYDADLSLHDAHSSLYGVNVLLYDAGLSLHDAHSPFNLYDVSLLLYNADLSLHDAHFSLYTSSHAFSNDPQRVQKVNKRSTAGAKG